MKCDGQKCEKFARMFALRMTWKPVIVTFLGFVLSLYLTFALVNDRYMHHYAWYEQPAPCLTPQFIMNGMIELTFSVSRLLTRLNISHVICYGTLWGALRNGQILPWDNNVDFCALKSEIQKVPYAALKNEFQSNGMDVTYDYRHGTYIVTHGPSQAVINVFYLTAFGEVFQDGFEYRFLWFFQENPVTFPAWLIESPVKTASFHSQQIPVPHDGIEILKYLYKNDWWLVKPPVGCEVSHSSVS